jgi:hypothetical protein
VAALFGDRVLSVFMLQGRLLAAIDLIIGEQDSVFVDHSVHAVAIDYRLLPVVVMTREGAVVEQPLKARLKKGDRLIGLIALPDLQRLVRREAAARDCLVEVTAFPLPAKDWLASLVRTRLSLRGEEALQKLANLPLYLGNEMSHGEAEDLVALLSREKIAARLVRSKNPASGVG